MNRLPILVAGALLLATVGGSPQARAAEEKVAFGPFGEVTVYAASRAPRQVVLFVSGDGGWNQGVVDMARVLTSLDALVVGIDIRHYLRKIAAAPDPCSYAGADFEALSQFIQKTRGFHGYVAPILVGYSSGATLVYAVLAQSPPDTFRGAISLGFCPDLTLAKPLCRRNQLDWEPGPKGKGYVFKPVKHLEAPWIALQGEIDEVCAPASTRAYVAKVGGGTLIMLPEVGHGYSVPRHWVPQFKAAFQRIAVSPLAIEGQRAPDLKGLPLAQIPVARGHDDHLAVILSGDGGWASIDRQIGGVLAQAGMPVVGLDTLRYFWHRRTPEEASEALARILTHYGRAWGKKRFILVGYSLGADVLPFMVNRLPEDLRSRVDLVALLGPGLSVDFKFHLTEWFRPQRSKSQLLILPEAEKLEAMKILCIYGAREKESLCPSLAGRRAVIVKLPGEHHFDGKYESLGARILAEVRPQP